MHLGKPACLRTICKSIMYFFWTLFGTPFELAAKYNFQVRKLLPGDGNGSLGTEICGKVASYSNSCKNIRVLT